MKKRLTRILGVAGVVTVVTLIAGTGISPRTTDADPLGAIISNGTVQLGVNNTGSLNFDGGTPSSGEGETIVGIRYVPTNADATSPGCTCEGWGAGDLTTAVEGYANTDSGDSPNLVLVSFTADADSATAVVDVGTTLRVTHDYQPSGISDNVYDVTVSLQNISADPIHLLYRRSMDWDVEPTAFDEFVTLVAGDSDELVFTSNGGFDDDHVLEPPDDDGFNGSFEDAGPDDHGALFDFDFGTLGAGATKTFTTFYGAAGNEVDALAALADVGAEAYTLGQPSSEGGPDLGVPNTFFFGFKGIGGTAIGGEDDDDPTATPRSCIPGLPTYSCGGQPGGGVSRQATATPASTVEPTVAPATPTAGVPVATATRPGGTVGGITAPDTGSGPGGSDGGSNLLMLALGALGAVALSGGMFAATKRR